MPNSFLNQAVIQQSQSSTNPQQPVSTLPAPPNLKDLLQQIAKQQQQISQLANLLAQREKAPESQPEEQIPAWKNDLVTLCDQAGGIVDDVTKILVEGLKVVPIIGPIAGELAGASVQIPTRIMGLIFRSLAK